MEKNQQRPSEVQNPDLDIKRPQKQARNTPMSAKHAQVWEVPAVVNSRDSPFAIKQPLKFIHTMVSKVVDHDKDKNDEKGFVDIETTGHLRALHVSPMAQGDVLMVWHTAGMAANLPIRAQCHTVNFAPGGLQDCATEGVFSLYNSLRETQGWPEWEKSAKFLKSAAVKLSSVLNSWKDGHMPIITTTEKERPVGTVFLYSLRQPKGKGLYIHVMDIDECSKETWKNQETCTEVWQSLVSKNRVVGDKRLLVQKVRYSQNPQIPDSLDPDQVKIYAWCLEEELQNTEDQAGKKGTEWRVVDVKMVIFTHMDVSLLA